MFLFSKGLFIDKLYLELFVAPKTTHASHIISRQALKGRGRRFRGILALTSHFEATRDTHHLNKQGWKNWLLVGAIAGVLVGSIEAPYEFQSDLKNHLSHGRAQDFYAAVGVEIVAGEAADSRISFWRRYAARRLAFKASGFDSFSLKYLSRARTAFAARMPIASPTSPRRLRALE